MHSANPISLPPSRSGKLQVVEKVLSHWLSKGHKALLFCQTQQMLDIVEKMAEAKVGGLLLCSGALTSRWLKVEEYFRAGGPSSSFPASAITCALPGMSCCLMSRGAHGRAT